MPVHSFTDPATGATIDVYVSASAPATEHQTQVLNGVTYKRVYHAPRAAIDTRIGDATEEDFRRRTTGKAGLKIGDMWQESAEMSAKRIQRDGVDTVREAHYARHERETGEKHEDVVRRERLDKTNAKLSEWGIKVTL